MPKRILACFAHPDDEAFGTGGALARYAAAGQFVALVCATRGEEGEISDAALADRASLGQVREEELRCAAETVGVEELIFMDYRDSGMQGTPANNHPRAFCQAPAEAVVPRLVAIIRRLQPDVVVTFEPNGGYGHPDHIAIHHHTRAAFFAAADPALYPQAGQAWQARRLFYTAIPDSFFDQLRAELKARGLDTSDLDEFADGSDGWPDGQVNVTLDVTSTIEDKWEALTCHRTQFGPGNLFRRLPEPVAKQLMSKEYFALAWPEPGPGAQLDDLLTGL